MSYAAIRTLARLAIVAALVFASPLRAQAPAPESPIEGQILVRLRLAADLPGVLATHALANVDQFGTRPIYRLAILDGASPRDKAATVGADPRVASAEPNYIHAAPESRKNVVWAIGGSEAGWAAQWAAGAIGLATAHAVSKGAGVRVAVLDTGVDRTHPALASRLAPGYDFVDGDDDPSEAGDLGDAGFGHGTHVAGLVALVAPQATIVPLRVLEPSGLGNLWVLGEALLHAVDPDGDPSTDDGAHVINLSLGTTRETKFIDKLVELATCGDDDDDDDDDGGPGFEDDEARCNLRSGAVVVAAAGNSASARQKQYPAAEGVDGLIAVAASTASARIARWSNRGPWIGLAAPGESIVSAVPDGAWGLWSGTSMAAPIVAGVAALLRADQPSWKPVDVTKRMQDRSRNLCGTSLRIVDAAGALLDYVPPDRACP